jgi:UDP-N-acetylglucosamine--N-acetylmuramyl-(pentapeptide) pyrophosphoryl-undecaprenol N-acetylglucosamine transferase
MNITLAAGGTGGHMVPAHALAAELKARGHGVMLVTDERGSRIPALFKDVPTHILPAGRLGGGPIGWLKAARSVLEGRRQAKALYREFTPDAVVGFGGYPALPALLAASALDIPTILHEQNAVLGRVNRLLASSAHAIATSYAEVDRLKPSCRRKVELVGNPVRETVARLGTMPFPEFDETAPLKILITGGSQGASVLGQVVPDALGMLPPKLRHRLQVVQQCRPDDIEAVRNRYAALNIPAELLTYIEDMPGMKASAPISGRSTSSASAGSACRASPR